MSKASSKPRKKPVKLTARTANALKAAGWHTGLVERFVPQCRQTFDLFGFIDLVGISPCLHSSKPYSGQQLVGIQVTTTNHQADRINKILTQCLETATAWLQARGLIVVIGWAKKGPRGKAKLWTPTATMISLDSFHPSTPQRSMPILRADECDWTRFLAHPSGFTPLGSPIAYTRTQTASLRTGV